MRLLDSIDAIDDACEGAVVSVGNFDGVHRGHLSILNALKSMGRQLSAPTLVFTFDPHPLTLLKPEAAPAPLCWMERKATLLGDLGIDFLLAYPTSPALLDLDYRSFFQKVIRGRLKARGMVEGANFFFGKNREGNVQRLKQLCGDAHTALEILELNDENGAAISSSRIRAQVSAGAVDVANMMLTSPYRIAGEVVRGEQRGRSLGFPTANLTGCPVLIPAQGVYAGWALFGDQRQSAAIHIGPNPTFGVRSSKVEIHLIDFVGDLYDQRLEVEFHSRVREVRVFDSAEQLQSQLQEDVREVHRRTSGL